MVWAVILALALVALIALVQPFFRPQTQTPDALDDQDYLAAQLADIERDRAAGLLSDDGAEAAALEARRRLLGSLSAKATAPASAQARMASVILIGAAPAAAVAIYMAIGNPSLAPGERETPRVAPPPLSAGLGDPASAPSLTQSIEQLAARLEQTPDDLDGWIMLAESYASTDRFAQAADAFTRAAALAPERAFLHAALGEALAMADGGRVNDDARAAVGRALEIDPAEPRARFYSALAIYQAGDANGALDRLIALANDAPPDAQWLSIVGRQIAALADELGRPLDELSLTPAARADLSGSPSAQTLEAQIAAGGAPYTDWLELIDAYAGSGDMERAAGALARGRARYQGAPFVLQELDAAAARLGLEAGGNASPRRGPSLEQMEAAAEMSEDDRDVMIEGMVEGLAARLENEPGDLEGWMMLGRSYGVLARPADSAAAFARAVDLAPDNIAARAAYAEALLSNLDAEGQPIDAETLAAIRAVERLNPDEPFALYFLGLAAQQQGDAATAGEYWRKLLVQLPEGSADAANIQAMIEAL